MPPSTWRQDIKLVESKKTFCYCRTWFCNELKNIHTPQNKSFKRARAMLKVIQKFQDEQIMPWWWYKSDFPTHLILDWRKLRRGIRLLVIRLHGWQKSGSPTSHHTACGLEIIKGQSTEITISLTLQLFIGEIIFGAEIRFLLKIWTQHWYGL